MGDLVTVRVRSLQAFRPMSFSEDTHKDVRWSKGMHRASGLVTQIDGWEWGQGTRHGAQRRIVRTWWKRKEET